MKKFLAMLLTVCMVLSLLPVNVLAAVSMGGADVQISAPVVDGHDHSAARPAANAMSAQRTVNASEDRAALMAEDGCVPVFTTGTASNFFNATTTATTTSANWTLKKKTFTFTPTVNGTLTITSTRTDRPILINDVSHDFDSNKQVSVELTANVKCVLSGGNNDTKIVNLTFTPSTTLAHNVKDGVCLACGQAVSAAVDPTPSTEPSESQEPVNTPEPTVEPTQAPVEPCGCSEENPHSDWSNKDIVIAVADGEHHYVSYPTHLSTLDDSRVHLYNTNATKGKWKVPAASADYFKTSGGCGNHGDPPSGDQRCYKYIIKKDGTCDLTFEIGGVTQTVTITVLPDPSASTHTFTKVPATVSTCVTKGVKEHYTCSEADCADKYFDAEGSEVTLASLELALDASNHEGETGERGARAATCVVDAKDPDTYCLACNETITEGAVKEGTATGHGDWTYSDVTADSHTAACGRCDNYTLVNVEHVYDQEGDKCVCGAEKVKVYPVQILDAEGNVVKGYDTVQAALTAAEDGQTVQLLDDVSYTAEYLLVSGEKTITLDLNKHTLDGTYTSAALLVHANATVKIKNGTINNASAKTSSSAVASGILCQMGTVELDNVAVTTKGTFGIQLGVNVLGYWGSATIKNSNISNGVAGASVAIFGPDQVGKDATGYVSTLTVSGTSVLKGDYYGIMGNGSAHNTVIDLGEGVTVLSDYCGIYHPQVGTMTTSADIIGAEECGIEIRSGSLTVNGGAITGGTKTFSCNANASGTTTVGAAIAVAQHKTKQDISVTINGGTLTGVKALNESNPQANDPAPQVTLKVTDGTFNGDVTVADTQAFISGGTFSSDVSEYCVEGMEAVEKNDETGMYEIATVQVAEVNGVAYATLDAAFAAAIQAEKPVTVKLLRDVDLTKGNIGTETLLLDLSGVTIDLNQKTLTTGYIATNKPIVKFLNEFTLKNGTIQSTGSYGISTGIRKDAGYQTADEVAVIEDVTILGGGIAANSNVELINVTATGSDYYGLWADFSGHITVKSGTYGSNGIAVLGLMTSSSSIVIEDGAFSALGTNTTMVLGNKNDSYGAPLIKGGTFNKDMENEDATLDENLMWAKNDEGLFTPVKDTRTVYIASTYDVYGRYATIQDAINAWTEEDASAYHHILLTEDTEEDVEIPAGKSVRIATGDSDKRNTWKGTVTNEGSLFLEQYSRVDVTVNTAEGASFGYDYSIYSTSALEKVNYTYYCPGWLSTAEEGWLVSGDSSAKVIDKDGKERLYATAQDAIDAAQNGETVVLTSSPNANLVIAEGQDITLDLNKQQVRTASSGKSKPVITNNGTLTIKDSKNGSSGLCQRSGSTAVLIENNGTLTIESGKIAPTNTVDNVKNVTFSGSGDVTVNGGTFTQDIRGNEKVTPGKGLQFTSDGKGVEEKLDETNAVAKIVSGDATTYYKTLQAAIDAAEDGATVTVLRDTDEAISYPSGKSLTITANPENKPTLSGGIDFAKGSVAGSSVTIENLNFTGKKGIMLITWSKVSGTDEMTALTIRNNTFTDCGDYKLNNVGSYDYAIHINNGDIPLTGLTVENNVFTNCPTGALSASVWGECVITDNTIIGSGYNAIYLNSSDNKLESLTVTNNTINGWGAHESTKGRAMRLSNIECAADLSGNSFVCENMPEEYIKLKPRASTENNINLNNCYWGGSVPEGGEDVPGGLFVPGGVMLNYYADAEMENLVDLCVASITKADGSIEKFLTVQAAITAAESGDTVVLMKDVTENVEITDGMNVTLDLSGKTLTNKEAGEAYTGTITVRLGGTLTVEDSSEAKTGTVDNVTHARTALYNYGKVTINGGTFTRSQETSVDTSTSGGNSYYVILNSNDMTINNATVTATGNFSSLVNNVWDTSETNGADAVLTINDGTFTNGNSVIKNSNGGVLTVNGGTLTSAQLYAVSNFGTATLNDGAYNAWLYNQLGSNATKGKGELTIHGGTYSLGVSYQSGTVSIDGGTFGQDVSDYCVTGYCQNADSGLVGEHDLGELVAAKTATCTTDGMAAHYQCSICGTYFDSDKAETTEADLTVAATGHDMTHHDAVGATCTEAGTVEYWSCANCGKDFADDEGKTELTDLTGEAAKGHDYGDWTDAGDGNHTRVCANDATHVDTAAHTPATAVNENVIAVQGCTTDGSHDEVVYCSDCEAELSRENKVDKAPGHNTLGSVAHMDATCTTPGVVGGTYCSACDEGKAAAEAVINALGHSYGAPVWSWADPQEPTATFACQRDNCSNTVVKTVNDTENAVTYSDVTLTAATCTTAAQVTRTAAVSFHGEYTDSTVVTVGTALGHNALGSVAHADATCATPGVVGGAYCSVCDEGKAAAEAVIPATGHNALGSVAHVDATCATPGVVGGSYCSVCDEGRAAAEAVIPATGHNTLGSVTHVDATCATPGVVGGTYCSVCDEGKAAAEAVIPATGHNYGEAVVTWTEDHTSVTVTITCAICGDVQTATAEGEDITETVVEAQVGQAGSRTYSATVTLDGNEFTVTSDSVVIPALPSTSASVSGNRRPSGGSSAPVEDLEDPDVPLAQPFPFTDVTESDWSYSAIKFAYDNGLMQGINTEKTLFGPALNTTRGCIITILHRFENEPAATAASFDDVADDAWYAAAVNWGAENGVIQGFGDGSYRPEMDVDREQLVLILFRYAQNKGNMDVAKRGDLTAFADASSVSDWAKEAMEWAVGFGLINGRDGATLAPQGVTTRAELATILQRFLGTED